MSPGASKLEKTTPMFLDRLYDSKVIKHKMFSVYFTNFWISENAKGSRLELGGYNLKKYAKNPEKKVMWAPLIHEFYWMCKLTKAELTGAQVYPFTMMNASTQVIFDTGTSLIVMPSPDFETIKYFMKNALKLEFMKFKAVWRS
jgi:hypothetical protein